MRFGAHFRGRSHTHSCDLQKKCKWTDFLKKYIILYLFSGQIEQQNPQSHYWPQQYQYQVPQHPNHQDSHYWPPQYQYQVPYNLTKGQFEVWQMEAMATGIDQMSYSSQHIVYQGNYFLFT